MSVDAIPPTSPVQATAGVRTGTGSGTPQSPPPTAVAGGAAPAAAQATELEAARQAANRVLQQNGCELAFEFDDASKRVIARLIDTKTKEVLRQVPSRETLAIARALAEDRSQGVLLQTNA